jgi:hypothetical protein
MSERTERPTIYAPCSHELLAATKAEAKRRDMTLAGFIRQTLAARLGLPADFRTQPPETTGDDRKPKKKLARLRGRG